MVSYGILITVSPGLATFRKIDFEVPLRLSTARERWCDRCKIVRPNMAKHCHFCDVCILGWDHHCPWSTKCIAKRNMPIFCVFVLSVCVLFVVVLGCLTLDIDKIDAKP